MPVAYMAMLEVYFYVLVFLTTLLALLSYWFIGLAYVNAVFLMSLLYIQVINIPLQLNWSRNLYPRLLRRQFFVAAYTTFIYAVHFYFGGIIPADGSKPTMMDALHLSLATWTTLGAGDLATVRFLNLATSLEGLTGIVTMAIITATIWLYCQDRLWKPSRDAKEFIGVHFQFDHVMGLWREEESEKTRSEATVRACRTVLKECPKCNHAVRLEKYYDISGRLVPFPWFVVVCDCGAHSRLSRNGYLAEYQWNRYGPVKPQPQVLNRTWEIIRYGLLLWLFLIPFRVCSDALFRVWRVLRRK